MEQFNPLTQMLQLIEHPAFCVEDGTITAVNSHAQQLLLHTGTKIAQILRTGQHEYQAFTNGCLYLNLNINGSDMGASVRKIDERDIFIIEQDADMAQLQTMALVAQELRRPLSSVMTVADRLFPMISDEDDTQSQLQMSRINRGLFQMLRVISNMSDAFRYAQDDVRSQEPHEIAAVLHEVFHKAEALMEHTGINLEFFNLDQPVYMMADVEKIERAIYNMLSNAMKFTGAGGTIRATVARHGDRIYLSVQDTGTGICRDRQADVFSRYLRSPGIEDGRFGIGLGMVLIRSAATQHGGTVLLDQPEGTGNRITLTLKIRQDTGGTLRSSMLHVDYTGERDHALVELSDALPAEAYHNKCIH